MKKHRVPTHKEVGCREPDGILPDVQIACTDCGFFGVKDGQDGCDRWAESVEVQCAKTYSNIRCEKTKNHKGGCERKWISNGRYVGEECLDRLTYFHNPGTIKPDVLS